MCNYRAELHPTLLKIVLVSIQKPRYFFINLPLLNRYQINYETCHLCLVPSQKAAKVAF